MPPPFPSNSNLYIPVVEHYGKGLRVRGCLASLALCASGLLAGSLRAQINVTTYQYDISRSGQNTQETVLTPANVNSSQFGKLFTATVDGYVYAQPLYVASVAIGGGIHNVIFVATEHDSVYAIDADTGTVYWHASLIPAGGRTVLPDTDIGSGCNDLVPEIGITGTPVIDPVGGTLYVVAKSVVGGKGVQYLHALDLGTAAEKFGGPVNIKATVAGSGYDSKNSVVTFNPIQESQRPALLLENGHVVIAWASHCDYDPWHGWVMSYSASSLAQEAVYNTTPNGYKGGIWMSGGGVSADTSGNLYFSSGNGDWNGTTDFGDSVIKLGPPTAGSFAILDYFTPYNQASLDPGDIDVSSSSPILLPTLPSGRQLLAQMGKSGTIYVLDRNDMGHYCPDTSPPCTNSDPQIFQEISGATDGIWGAPAYWNGLIYWGPQNEPLTAFSFNTTTGQVSTSPVSRTAQIFGYPAPTPTISANGATDAILWVLDGSAYDATCSGGRNCQVLYAYDATKLGTLLYSSSQAQNYRDVPGSAIKFAVPTVANGKVYVGSQYAVSAFGELASGAPTTASPTLTPSPGSYSSAQTITIADATPGAAIYYTTDGLTPTTNSTPYSGAITVSASTPVLAVAVASGYAASVAGGGTYIINSGTGSTPQSIDLSSVFNTSGIDAIQVSGTAVQNGGLDGAGNALAENLTGTSIQWAGAAYVLGLAGQSSGASSTTISFPPGTYSAVSFLAVGVNGNQPGQTFTLNYADGTSGNFTQSISDWNTPQQYSGESTALAMAYEVTASGATANAAAYVYGYTFAVPSGETVQSITLPNNRNVVLLAIDVTPLGGVSVEPAAANPTFSPIQGTYSTAQTVTLSDTTSGAAIYYTLDGSTPTTSSAQYSTPLSIAGTTTINAIATATGYTNSVLSTAVYTIVPPPTLASPLLSPPPGTFTAAQTVVITDPTPGAAIYYTLDGSTPTTSSAQYGSPLTIGATTTVNAIAVEAGFADSAVAGGIYAIDEPPQSPAGINLTTVGNVYGLGSLGTAASGGLDRNGDVYAADLLGTTITAMGATFTLSAAGPGSAVSDATVPLPPGNDSGLIVLATGVNGNQVDQEFTVTYTDGSTSSFTRSLSDWFTPQAFAGESTTSITAYAVDAAGAPLQGPVYLYAYEFSLNSAKTVQSLTLPANANVAVLAIDVVPIAAQDALNAAAPGSGRLAVKNETGAVVSAVAPAGLVTNGAAAATGAQAPLGSAAAFGAPAPSAPLALIGSTAGSDAAAASSLTAAPGAGIVPDSTAVAAADMPGDVPSAVTEDPADGDVSAAGSTLPTAAVNPTAEDPPNQ